MTCGLTKSSKARVTSHSVVENRHSQSPSEAPGPALFSEPAHSALCRPHRHLLLWERASQPMTPPLGASKRLCNLQIGVFLNRPLLLSSSYQTHSSRWQGAGTGNQKSRDKAAKGSTHHHQSPLVLRKSGNSFPMGSTS